MSPSYLPVTVDGREIDIGAPRSRGMSDEQAQVLVDKAEEYRQTVPHFHYDLTDRDLTVYAANFPDGPVIFNFGDRSGELTEQSQAAQASAMHTYATDGTYVVSVRNEKQRWSMDVPVNWPEKAPPPPEPAPEETDPRLDSIDPESTPNVGTITLRALGDHFTVGSQIYLGSATGQTAFVSEQELTISLSVDGAPATQTPVTVRTGEHTTEPQTFSITEQEAT